MGQVMHNTWIHTQTQSIVWCQFGEYIYLIRSLPLLLLLLRAVAVVSFSLTLVVQSKSAPQYKMQSSRVRRWYYSSTFNSSYHTIHNENVKASRTNSTNSNSFSMTYDNDFCCTFAKSKWTFHSIEQMMCSNCEKRICIAVAVAEWQFQRESFSIALTISAGNFLACICIYYRGIVAQSMFNGF